MALRERLEQIRSNPVPDNEEAAKIRILVPVLAELSWDPSGQEVLWEHPVGGKRTGGKADIALKAEGRIWAIIEAKAPGANLDQHVEQVLGYAFYEGVDICALSDGLQWWLYLPRETGSHEERRFAILDLAEDPVDQVCNDLSAFLSRESLLGGQAVERARQVRRALREAARLEKEMPGIWRQMLDEPDSELVKLIGQRVYDRLSLRPGRDQIVAAIRNRSIPPNKPHNDRAPRTDPPSAPEPSPAFKPEDTPPEKPSPRRPTTRPAAIRLWGERHSVRTHQDVLMTVVNALHHGHREDFYEVTAQIKVGKSLIVASHPEPLRQSSTKQTASGCYVDVNLSATSIKWRAVKLLEAFGYSESDLEYLYDG